MAIITNPQSARRFSTASNSPQPAPTVDDAFSPLAPHARFQGNSRARSHPRPPRIIYPESYHERFRLPPGIERQPF